MTRASYAEACVEAMEARWAFEAALEKHREKNVRRRTPEFHGLDEAGRPEWVTYVRLERIAKDLRPAPEAPTEADKADAIGDERMEARRVR